MDTLERAIHLCIGGGVGYILGYIVARLRYIETKVEIVQKEVHEVDEIVKHDRGERGSVRLPSLSSILMLAVLSLTVYAAFSTAKVNEELDDTVACLTEYNTNQGNALETRDKATKSATHSEIELWALYERLYQLAKSDPKKIPVLQEQLNKAIIRHKDSLIKTQKIREVYEYDDPDVLADCEERKS